MPSSAGDLFVEPQPGARHLHRAQSLDADFRKAGAGNPVAQPSSKKAFCHRDPAAVAEPQFWMMATRSRWTVVNRTRA